MRALPVRTGLIGLALGALVVVVVLLARPHHHHPAAAASSGATVAWSRWHPSSSGNAGAGEIADYISHLYRTPSLRRTPAAVTPRLTGGETIGYDLCGAAGSGCSVPGTLSSARMLLQRREALELALYTFKYVRGPSTVVVLLASARRDRATLWPRTAVLLHRAEVAAMLTEPIETIFTPQPPATARLRVWGKSAEAQLVTAVTAHSLFSARVAARPSRGDRIRLSPVAAA